MSDKIEYTNFEEALRTSQDAHEVAFDGADWDRLEKVMDQNERVNSTSKYKILGLAGLLVGASSLFLFHNNPTPTATDNNTETIVKNEVAHITKPKIVVNTAPSSAEISSEDNETIRKKTSTPDGNDDAENKQDRTTNSKSSFDRMSIRDSQVFSSSEESNSEILEQNNKQPIEIYKQPTANFTMSTLTCCQGEKIFLSVDEPITNCKYHWIIGDELELQGTTALWVAKHQGSTDVKLIVSPEHGKSVAGKQVLRVNPLPKNDFHWNAPDERSTDPSYNFQTDFYHGDSYNWDFGDGKTAKGNEANHTYKKKSSHRVTLSVNNIYGCINTISKTVHVNVISNLGINNTLSPNGDNINDTWLPNKLKSGDYIFTIAIISVSGNKQVFTTNDSNNPWDGRVNGGEFAKVGDIFGWIANVKDKEGVSREYAGTVIITP